jgi:hypothetical protein
VLLFFFPSVSLLVPVDLVSSHAGLQSPVPEVIVDVESMDIFPVGWCEANSYPLTTPHKTVCKCGPVERDADNIYDLGELVGSFVKEVVKKRK